MMHNARFIGSVRELSGQPSYIFILAFLLASGSSQLGESHTNEIKHDIHPE